MYFSVMAIPWVMSLEIGSDMDIGWQKVKLIR